MNKGIFTISLDYEMFWGVRDKRTISEYMENLRGTPAAIDQILAVFDDAGIHATWAVVGFLFCRNQEDLLTQLPAVLPGYSDRKLSPYDYIENTEELEEPYHFAPDLIERIQQGIGQEVGTHTFSHFYCAEEGQNQAEFRADLAQAVNIADRDSMQVKSLVFPRNQVNSEYVSTFQELGITSYRGTESGWVYKPASTQSGRNLLRRGVRLLDAYINLTGSHSHDIPSLGKELPINIPSSRFLRPYSSRASGLYKLHIRRVLNEMTEAAKSGKLYHLWWHPHNFGVHTSENLKGLRSILKHFRQLNQRYGMQSLNMGEVSDLVSS